MKAKREEAEFLPIIITLESKKEADLLWYLLNYNEEELTHKYAESRGFDLQTALHYTMWKVLNLVHHPRVSNTSGGSR